MADKRAALVDIGRHLGMFKDKVEVTGKDGKDLIPEETDQARLALVLLNILVKDDQEDLDSHQKEPNDNDRPTG